MAGKGNKPFINPMETLNDFGGRELVQAGKDFRNSFVDQVLGTGSFAIPKSGELQPGQELNLKKTTDQDASVNQIRHNETRRPEKARTLEAVGGIRYHEQFRSLDSEASVRETHEMRRAINEIQVELQRLVASSSLLQVEFSSVSMSQAPSTPGKYHVNFFAWILTVIRQARMKVEDAGAWQATLKNKRGKAGFWGRAKKEGTQFLQNVNRSAATQTG